MIQKTPAIEIKNLTKSFGANDVLKGITLSVNTGEDLVIIGRSGSGKSITIKCLVGLVPADGGEIKVFGTDITKIPLKELNEIRTRISFLFQSAALYDSMSVRKNLAFTLKHHDKNIASDQIENRISEALENVGLLDAIDKMPSELSGGMRKRIGLARSLIIRPEIMLYDEPTAGLDTITSREISDLILSIQEKHKTTSIIITHDMASVKRIGKKIMIIKEGVIYAKGSYEELEKSSDEWVRSFFI